MPVKSNDEKLAFHVPSKDKVTEYKPQDQSKVSYADVVDEVGKQHGGYSGKIKPGNKLK